MPSILSVIRRRPLAVLYAMQASVYAIGGVTTYAGEPTPVVCYSALALIGLLIGACHWRVVKHD